MPKCIKATAPATIANLACGFDVLGLALSELADQVEVELTDKPGVTLTEISGDNGLLPREAERNTATVGIKALLNKIGSKQGMLVRLKKNLPLGSGLGSSAASAVAGVVAANAILGEPLARDQLLEFALEGERIACGAAHADNAAPSLLGGVVLVTSYSPLKTVRIEAPAELYACVVHPELEVKTAHARAVLRRELSLATHVVQSACLAGFIAGLYRSDYELIASCLKDYIIEPQRAALITGFWHVKQAALEAGALGCSISGSGPSVFALARGETSASTVTAAMRAAFGSNGISCSAHFGLVNNCGAKVQ